MTAPLVQLKDIAVGLKYLHSQRVIHGDLKGVQPPSLAQSPHLPPINKALHSSKTS